MNEDIRPVGTDNMSTVFLKMWGAPDGIVTIFLIVACLLFSIFPGLLTSICSIYFASIELKKTTTNFDFLMLTPVFFVNYISLNSFGRISLLNQVFNAGIQIFAFGLFIYALLIFK